jgi:nitrate reductase gamma subunit
MRDHWLFAIAPYAAAAVAAIGLAARLAAGVARGSVSAPATGTRPAGVPRLAWQVSVALIALAHIAAIAFPDGVLLWTRRELRLVALEIEGLAAGVVALVGVLLALARATRRRRVNPPAIVDIAALTLVAVSMTSGVVMAFVYRWASSWAEVTLVPYLYSLGRFGPATELVTHLPALVKLHLASAFAVVAIAPYTSASAALAARVGRVLHAAGSPVGRLGPACRAAEQWTVARLRLASAVMFGTSGEEN